MNEELSTSKIGLEFIAHWEGCILQPYKDVAGLRTIGVGHLIVPGENYPDGVSITTEQAYELLSKDVAKCENSIKKNIGVQLTQDQFDALVSFGFNCGTGVYSTSGACKTLNSGNYDQVPAKLLDWSKAVINGQLTVVKGLYDRRNAEGILFSGTVPWTKISIASVQQQLQQLGLYSGKVDGVWGPKTSAAVTQYSQNIGFENLNVSTGVTREFLESLNNQTT